MFDAMTMGTHLAGLMELGETAALIVTGYVVLRNVFQPMAHAGKVALAVMFAIAVLHATFNGVAVGEGVVIDLRGTVLALAALFGGPVVGGAALVTAEVARLYVGGSGLIAGLVGNALATAVGLFAYYAAWRRRGGDIGFKALLGVAGGVVLGINLAYLLVAPFDGAVPLRPGFAPAVSLAQLVAIPMLGGLLAMETRRRQVHARLLVDEAK